MKRINQKELDKFYKKNIVYLKRFYRNIGDNVDDSFDRIKISVEKKVLDIKNFSNYTYNKYFIPNVEKETVNKTIKIQDINKEVILVLSGGGARGSAHIGVLKYILENGLQVKAIVGTSVGSIIGGLYASGYSPYEIDDIFQKEKSNFLKLEKSGLKTIKKRTKIYKNIIKKYFKKNLEDCEIPLFVNVADVKNSQRVIYEKGDMYHIVKASSAIPFYFEPEKYDDKILYDGGVSDNFCVDMAHKINEDKNYSIIISDVSAATDETSNIKTSNFFFKLSKDFVENIDLIGNKHFPVRNEKDILSLINNMLYMLQQRETLGPEIQGGEIIITPHLKKMGMLQFSKHDFAFKEGYNRASKVLL